MDYSNRIGTWHENGAVEWPPLNIYGAGYSLPANTIGLGNGRFVVIPANFSDLELLAAVQASLKPKGRTKGSEL